MKMKTSDAYKSIHRVMQTILETLPKRKEKGESINKLGKYALPSENFK